MPYTLRLLSTTDMASRPIFAVQVSCQKLVAASRIKRSSSAPFKFPGITSRLTNGRSGAELPTSRQSSTQAIAALRSSGSDSVLASIRIGSDGLVPVRRRRPRLLGCATAPNNVQPASGRPNRAILAEPSALSSWACDSFLSEMAVKPIG
jgi:hypothetical protein